MSRIGKKPVVIADKVKVKLDKGLIYVEGPKGKLHFKIPQHVDITVTDKEVLVKRKSEEREYLAMHGTVRASINNMIQGVSTGFSKILDIVGVGYKAESKGRELALALGYSHPVIFPLPEGIDARVDKQTRITVSGADKQAVGEVAAKIRMLRPPEPYKGKGIRYAGEVVKQKVGKAAISSGG